MTAGNPERGDAAVQAALLAAQMNKGRGAQPDKQPRFVVPGNPKRTARSVAPVVRVEQACPYHGPGGPPAADGGAPTAMALGIPADGSVDGPGADTAVLPEEPGAPAEPTERIFTPHRVDLRVGVAEPVNAPAENQDEPLQRRRFSISALKDLRVGGLIYLSRSVRRGRANIPRTEFQILDPDATFATHEEMLAARAEGRKSAVNDTKEERNTYFAFAIEDIWKNVGRIKKDFQRHGSPAGIGMIDIDTQGRERSRKPFTPKSRHGGYSAEELRTGMRSILRMSTNKYIDAKEKEAPYGVPDEAISQEGRNFRRLTELTGIINGGRSEAEFMPVHPETLLQGGAKTAVSTVWGLYEVAKPAFEAQYGKEPTKRDLDELFDSADDMAIPLAAGQLTVTIGMLGHLTTNPHQFQAGGYRHFNSDDFTVVEVTTTGKDGNTTTKKKLVLKEQTFEAYETRLDKALTANPHTQGFRRVDEDTTGCPALHAEGQGMGPSETDKRIMNVVAGTVQWAHQIAREQYDVYLAAA